jgi:hypothetical protein
MYNYLYNLNKFNNQALTYEGYPESKDTTWVGGERKSQHTVPLTAQTIPLTAQTSLHPAHSPDLTPSRSQPRPRSQWFPFVFAFKETSGRPEVLRRQRREKRSHYVVACTGGVVQWHQNKKTRIQAKQMPSQRWWLCWKIAKGMCWRVFSLDFVNKYF